MNCEIMQVSKSYKLRKIMRKDTIYLKTERNESYIFPLKSIKVLCWSTFLTGILYFLFRILIRIAFNCFNKNWNFSLSYLFRFFSSGGIIFCMMQPSISLRPFCKVLKSLLIWNFIYETQQMPRLRKRISTLPNSEPVFNWISCLC